MVVNDSGAKTPTRRQKTCDIHDLYGTASCSLYLVACELWLLEVDRTRMLRNGVAMVVK